MSRICSKCNNNPLFDSCNNGHLSCFKLSFDKNCKYTLQKVLNIVIKNDFAELLEYIIDVCDCLDDYGIVKLCIINSAERCYFLINSTEECLKVSMKDIQCCNNRSIIYDFLKNKGINSVVDIEKLIYTIFLRQEAKRLYELYEAGEIEGNFCY